MEKNLVAQVGEFEQAVLSRYPNTGGRVTRLSGSVRCWLIVAGGYSRLGGLNFFKGLYSRDEVQGFVF